MSEYEASALAHEAQVRDYRAGIVTTEDRLRARVAELEAEVAALRARLLGAYERVAAQSELLSRRAERYATSDSEIVGDEEAEGNCTP